MISQLSNLDYLKDLQQKYAIQNDLNNGQTKLAEVELTRLTSDNQRHRFKLQRQLEISRLQTKLELEKQKFDRTSRIISHAQGTVTQILTAADQFVQEGSPVVLLSSPKTTAPGTDDVEVDYESIVFVPAGEGKKVNEGNVVEVMPATVKREEHGFIKGRVIAVSELPATRMAMEAALQHPDLVETFLKRHAQEGLLRVHVKFEKESRRRSIDPSAPSARSTTVFSGRRHPARSNGSRPATMCEAAIVVEEQPLITLVIPWLKQATGTY